MIADFIYTGDFNDPFNEFFVEKLYRKKKSKKTTRSSSEKDFVFKLTADPKKIPSFLGDQIALAIFKVGSHVGLLQALDDYSPEIKDLKSMLSKTMDKLEHIGNQKYYSICSQNGASN